MRPPVPLFVARSLRLGVGEPLVLHLYGSPHELTVSDVVTAEGLAGMGLGASVNTNASAMDAWKLISFWADVLTQ